MSSVSLVDAFQLSWAYQPPALVYGFWFGSPQPVRGCPQRAEKEVSERIPGELPVEAKRSSSVGHEKRMLIEVFQIRSKLEGVVSMSPRKRVDQIPRVILACLRRIVSGSDIGKPADSDIRSTAGQWSRNRYPVFGPPSEFPVALQHSRERYLPVDSGHTSGYNRAGIRSQRSAKRYGRLTVKRSASVREYSCQKVATCWHCKYCCYRADTCRTENSSP